MRRRFHAENVCRDRTFGENDQSRSTLSGFIGKRLKTWPLEIEIRSIVCRGLYERDGYLSFLHEMQLPNDGSTLHLRRIHT
jgi:hypothetical protein